MSTELRTRSENEDLRMRKFTVSGAAGSSPSTLSEKDRSIEIVIASETDKILVWDWDFERGVPEILVMSGCVLPQNNQVPLLDSHGRYSVSDVLGSVRDFAVEDDKLIGKAFYSETPSSNDAFTKTKEGHLTDYSAGYRALKVMKLSENQSTVIGSRTYSGPCVLITEWELREVSTCPIGADPTAKARSDKPTKQPGEKAGSSKKEKGMDEKLRAYLIRCGMRSEATDDEAWAFLAALDATPDGKKDPGHERSETKDRENILTVERERTAAIHALCERHDCKDLAEGMIKGGKTVDDARAAVLDVIEKREKARDEEMPGFRVEMGVEGRDKFRAAAIDALGVRAGLVLPGGSVKLALGYDELMGRSQVEIARFCCRCAGVSDRGTPMEVAGRALTSSDFPIILSAIANKSLAQGYESAGETWSFWAATGSVNDFKIHTLARVSESDDLDEILEDGEYRYGALEEAQEQYAIATYGKMFRISRKAIINDDLSALTDIPAKHGEACARKIGDIAYAVLTANSNMGDGTALFHADHKNLADPATAIGTAGMAAGIKAMGLQKDMKGKRSLNIRPEFVLAPKSLEAGAEVFFTSEKFDTTNSGATRTNIYAGNKYTRIYEARLDDDSVTSWYLLAARGKTVKVFFLGGNMTPYMETRQGWNVDGVEYKVRIDAGAKALDWKTMYKNPGM